LNITITVNDVRKAFEIQPYETLLNLLRREGYTGAKRVCESGECGACAVIVDGRAVDSCIMLAAQADGRNVTTVEGLGDLTALSAVQEAFADNGSIQCGFCIPGMVVTAASYLEENPDPTEEEVRHVFVGNLCRCTGYVKPVEAVLTAAAGMRQGGPDANPSQFQE
jgi:aerobic-type carbon monoxide dehydrogenase small subunit (CoxS/CutS family)